MLSLSNIYTVYPTLQPPVGGGEISIVRNLKKTCVYRSVLYVIKGVLTYRLGGDNNPQQKSSTHSLPTPPP